MKYPALIAGVEEASVRRLEAGMREVSHRFVHPIRGELRQRDDACSFEIHVQRQHSPTKSPRKPGAA